MFYSKSFTIKFSLAFVLMIVMCAPKEKERELQEKRPGVKIFALLQILEPPQEAQRVWKTICSKYFSEFPNVLTVYMNRENSCVFHVIVSKTGEDSMSIEGIVNKTHFILAYGVKEDEVTFTGAMTFPYPGTYYFTIEVKASPHGSEEKKFITLVVNKAGPKFHSRPNLEVDVGEDFIYEVKVSDSDNEGDIKLSLETDCAWLKLDGNILKGKVEKGECYVTIIAEDDEGEKMQQCFYIRG